MRKDVILLVGRLCVALVFVLSVVGHLSDFEGIQNFMAHYGMPYTFFFLISSLLVRTIGSALIILGYQTNWGVALLTLFLIPATLIFHLDFKNPVESIAFVENVGLQGGLLLLAAAGPGRIALEWWQKRINPERAERLLLIG
jgi:putative oxidoreductase